jgi:cell division protein FtsZ
VSVVATGIDADAVQQPAPGKVFTFPAAQRASGKAATPAAETVEEEDAPLELGADEDSEELLLGDDDILTTPVGKPPIAPPTDEEAAEETPAAAASGGTLFERMSNIARGASKAELDEEPGESGAQPPIDIPRFLNRQNNQ